MIGKYQRNVTGQIGNSLLCWPLEKCECKNKRLLPVFLFVRWNENYFTEKQRSVLLYSLFSWLKSVRVNFIIVHCRQQETWGSCNVCLRFKSPRIFYCYSTCIYIYIYSYSEIISLKNCNLRRRPRPQTAKRHPLLWAWSDSVWWGTVKQSICWGRPQMIQSELFKHTRT